jgi:hypothetical protein
MTVKSHKTSYEQFKEWSKLEKFDPSGIATQNLHKNFKSIRK